ncbi:hypothetical protein HanRHA438_Chr01g0020741 [Helianthus annuus]|uniref:Uncharacterized protein n=1 Tax=Helianthus annuus TaxID=4232 RepID=A0A9K3P3D5_HELAN|nr:hypothetical protein HanXRQr2_Chr01g0020211 [Helianthus annuus]KAJ0611493.1 hypothetical protein HanHA300_Chr01g0016431 [Helianthus annuus]KAJ0622550.1 hypothetical protein HanIR_Chr01g0021931 [Helianthus annuus]KAJ0626792.1 hypothetical protein HanHA89_Chr01g0018051 [Helianthus annuus]KAJ0783141.1 hypothetical protein HanLR1_Chr01g0016991 [Helianthus annuus]
MQLFTLLIGGYVQSVPNQTPISSCQGKSFFFSPDSMTSLPWDDRKSKSVAWMKRAKGIWRFRRTVHGISYINAERCEDNTGFFFNGS